MTKGERYPYEALAACVGSSELRQRLQTTANTHEASLARATAKARRTGRRPWWPIGFQNRRTAFDSPAPRCGSCAIYCGCHASTLASTAASLQRAYRRRELNGSRRTDRASGAGLRTVLRLIMLIRRRKSLTAFSAGRQRRETRNSRNASRFAMIATRARRGSSDSRH